MTEAEKIKKLCEIIKRQKAEILYWKDTVRMIGVLIGAKENEMGKIITEHDNYVKSVAIKEFAERLKQKAYTNNYCQEVVLKDKIDNLVKEMVGDEQ